MRPCILDPQEAHNTGAGDGTMAILVLPNELCAEIHNRMPVILKPETWPAWLGKESADAAQRKGMLGPYPADEMASCPVSQQKEGAAPLTVERPIRTRFCAIAVISYDAGKTRAGITS